MPTNLPKPPFRFSRPLNAISSVGWGLAVVGVPVVFLAVSQVVPPALVLPTVGLMLICAGFALASWAWLPQMRTVPLRDRLLDVAGALVFMGFAASILTDGDQAIAAFDSLLSAEPTVKGPLD